MAREGFQTNVLFPSEEFENVISTILILVGIKSFEFIIKTLLTSTRQESVNTGKYALEIAADQAYNPLNYIRWVRGKPDFKHEDDKNFRKPIPLNRATLAVLICVIVLLAEAMFFYGTMSRMRELTNQQLRISVQTTNEHTPRRFTRNFCAPISVETGRAKMTAVFAFCNELSSEGGSPNAFPTTGDLDIRFVASKFSQTIRMSKGTGNVTVESKTVFSVLVPNVDEHLVVPYNGSNALIPRVHEEVRTDFVDKRRCTVDDSDKANGVYKLTACEHEVDLDKLMELVLSYTEVNNTHGEVGHEVGNNTIARENKPVTLGVIEEHKMTMAALVAVSLSLFGLSILVHVFVKNNNSEVIAAMMREKTLQDMRVPAFSMEEEIIRLDRSMDEFEGRSLQRTVHLRQSMDMSSVVSARTSLQGS